MILAHLALRSNKEAEEEEKKKKKKTEEEEEGEEEEGQDEERQRDGANVTRLQLIEPIVQGVASTKVKSMLQVASGLGRHHQGQGPAGCNRKGGPNSVVHLPHLRHPGADWRVGSE